MQGHRGHLCHNKPTVGLQTCLWQENPTMVKRKMRANSKRLFYFRILVRDKDTSRSSFAVIADLEQKADAHKGRTFAWYFRSPHLSLGNCIPVKAVAAGKGLKGPALRAHRVLSLFPCSFLAHCSQFTGIFQHQKCFNCWSACQSIPEADGVSIHASLPEQVLMGNISHGPALLGSAEQAPGPLPERCGLLG